jgi:signal transduction histidine kinase
MNTVHLLIGIVALLMIILCILTVVIVNEKRRLKYIFSILEDIEQGNMNRRVLAPDKDMTTDICHKINTIVENCKEQLTQKDRAQQANRQIMTSLSHDVKTPLTSLIGYLDAIHGGLVYGEEKDSYIEIAWNKAYSLKEYVDTLFEWFKLNSNERQFSFEDADINELTRNIVIGWIPQFEKRNIAYEIVIEDSELHLSIDVSAFTRIANNLVHNAILHSGGSLINIQVKAQPNGAVFSVMDNGKGISQESIPYIFDRLYKQDEARAAKGSGLGLSIAQELVKAHGGKISVDSMPYKATTFTVYLPRNR